MTVGRIWDQSTKRKSKIQRIVSALGGWFERSARDLPWRRTRDPYAILVSEFMLQQTQVATVIPYFERWMKRFPDLQALAMADEQEVLSYWQGLGYYTRARNLHKASRVIVEQHGGVFPRDPKAIRELPGVGRYTAGAVASFAFDLPEPLVDANVARVLSRLQEIRMPVDTPAGLNALYEVAVSLLPAEKPGLFNAAIMELGALVCVSGTPRCLECPIRSVCAAPDPENLPVKKPRRAVVRKEERAVFCRREDAVLLVKEEGRHWHGLWRLPHGEGNGEPLCSLEYPFTHHKITLIVRAGKDAGSREGVWIDTAKLADLPMPSPHRRALERILQEP